MHFTIDKQILENMLNSLQPFLEKRDMTLVTSHILLYLNGDELTLKSTDYEMGLEIKTSVQKAEESGGATANGKRISEIVRRLLDRELTIKTENDNLIIKQGRSTFKIPMFRYEEFPPFPNYQEFSKIELNGALITKSLKKIFPAVDTNNPKYELNGALIDIKDYSINFVGTDQKRLAIINYDNPSVDRLSIIIPKRAINEIQKLFFDDIELYYNQTNLVIRGGNYLFFTKLINGKFPEYERIIPKEIKHRYTISKTNMMEHIKLINSISNEIKITFEQGKVVIESIGDENSEALTEFEANITVFEKISISVNSKHIMDFLTQCEKEEFEFGMNDSNVPFMLQSENLRTIIMPIIM